MAEKTKVSTVYADAFVVKYLLSCCAATVAEAVTFPLDLMKTRLQIQGEGGQNSGPYRGMIRTAYGIVHEEGFLRLWQGITPAIYRHVVYTGCRMGMYEWIRDNILGKGSDGSYPVWKAALGGITAGALGQFMASPADLIKVQMQMEGVRRLQGKPPRTGAAGASGQEAQPRTGAAGASRQEAQPRVRGTWHAFRKILNQGGIRGLWKGWVPNVQRAALVNLGDLTTYDTAKHAILNRTELKDNYVTHALSSSISGLVGATMGTPCDVIKTRIMNQPTDAAGRGVLYKSSVDCLMKTIRIEGFFALYKGFIPMWTRMAPWSMAFWLSYEQIRKFAGTRSF